MSKLFPSVQGPLESETLRFRQFTIASCKDQEILMRCHVSPFGGLAKPSQRLGLIGAYAPTDYTHNAKVVLCHCKTLVRSLTVPFGRLCVIAKDTFDTIVHHSQIVLGRGQAAICGLPIPGHCLKFVFLYT